MKKIKKLATLLLSVTIFMLSMSSVLAAENTVDLAEFEGSTRMNSDYLLISAGIIDGSVCSTCTVFGPIDTVRITLLCILREKNAAGGFVIVDTWTDSIEDDMIISEHEYSPAAEGGEYELSVRVGIYNARGLVGYDYKTITGIQ